MSALDSIEEAAIRDRGQSLEHPLEQPSSK